MAAVRTRFMNAIGFKETGSLDVIEELEWPIPASKSNEVLVRVEYAGVNFADGMRRAGTFPGPTQPPPLVLGGEASGIIVELPSDEEVLASEEFKKRGLKLGGRVVVLAQGAFADFVAAPWENVYALPDDVSFKDGVAIFVQGVFGLTLIEKAYEVEAGDFVLVHSAAGGVGLSLSQLIAARGGIVIGTVSTEEKAALAKLNGATHVILYKNEDILARVLEITQGEGVHAIYDGVGKDTFEADFDVIRLGGTIVSIGSKTGTIPSFSPYKLLPKNVKFVCPAGFNYLKDPSDGLHYVNELYQLVSDGTLKVNIQKEYPFTVEGVRESQAKMQQGSSVGKSVIKLGRKLS